MKFCVFRLYAPLVSWGDIAVGGERRTTMHPSKSAIIGLVGAAAGIKREDEEQQQGLAASIGIGVKVISPGIMIKDFHTAQVPGKIRKTMYLTRKDEVSVNKEKLETILSRREYRCDALYIVALWLKDKKSGFSLFSIEQALKFPVYHLYLGRKSCPPALPLQPQILETKTMKEALDSAEFGMMAPVYTHKDLKERFFLFEKKLFCHTSEHYYWEYLDKSGFSEWHHQTKRYDMPLSRKRWQFSERNEYFALAGKEEDGNVHEPD